MKKLFSLLFIAFSLNTFCSAFTAGNIVVVRLGDGSGALSNASAQIFLDEYTVTGTLVQSIPLPTIASGGNHAITMSGSASSEGSLTLSTDRNYLSLAGYDAPAGVASVSSDSTINRTIARVDASGNVNTTTGINFGTAYKKNNIRGAVTVDGTNFYCSGNGSGNNGGTYYLPFGSFTSSAVQISTTVANTRVVNIFNNQLYVSSSSGAFLGVSSVGTGLPTANGQTTAILPGLPNITGVSNYGFYFCDLDAGVAGVDVLYVCDDRTTAPDGGLYKYSLVGGTWVSNGNITSGVGLRGITASKTCTAVSILVTGEAGVYGVIDNSGYNQPLTGTLTQIVTGVANTKIRGIAFTPGTQGSSGLTASVQSSSNVSCFGASNGSINISVNGATGNPSYNWGSGVTSQNRNNLAPGTYTVTVSDQGGCSATTSTTITEPSAALTASVSPTSVTCNGGANGSVNLTAAGGTPNYSYSWSNGASTQNLNNLTQGIFIVTVTDNNSCTATATATITQPTPISVTAAVTNLPCSGGGNTGAVNISVSGGNPNYTFAWSNSSATEDLTNLAAGTFTVTVTDNSSCTTTFAATVSQAGTLQISL